MTGPSVDQPVQHPTQRERVKRPKGSAWESVEDTVAREEPLEILVKTGSDEPRRLGLLLRTPGHDHDLALGLLFAEGLIESATDVRRVSFEPASGENQEFNSVVVSLKDRTVDWARVARPLVMSAACGVCGRAMLTGLHEHATPAAAGFTITRETLLALPTRLQEAQAVFARTGGLHAAALATAKGKIQIRPRRRRAAQRGRQGRRGRSARGQDAAAERVAFGLWPCGL
jgi:FdhD protein